MAQKVFLYHSQNYIDQAHLAKLRLMLFNPVGFFVLLLVLGLRVDNLKLLFCEFGWHRLKKIEFKNGTIYALKQCTTIIYIKNACKRLIVQYYYLVNYLLVDNHVWLLHNKVFVDSLLFLSHLLQIQQTFGVKKCNCVLHVCEDLFEKFALTLFLSCITIRSLFRLKMRTGFLVCVYLLSAVTTWQCILTFNFWLVSWLGLVSN